MSRDRLDKPGDKTEAQAGDSATAAPAGANVARALRKRGGGRKLDGRLRARFESRTSADLSEVRVHEDGEAQAAAAEIGARAFTMGSDIYLGGGESAADEKLMFHELAHVVQQSGGSEQIQRKAEIDDGGGDAEAEADAVADAAVEGKPTALIVEDSAQELETGQKKKSEFLARLRPLVHDAASDALGGFWSVADCPYVDKYLDHYGAKSAQHLERAIQRFAPETKGATSADAYVPLIVARVKRGVTSWRATGSLPPDAASVAPSDDRDTAKQSVRGGQDGVIQRKPLPGHRSAPQDGSPQQIVRDLGEGQALESTTAARVGGAMGANVSSVRVHTDAKASKMASEQGARAFTVGNHIAFGAGQYNPNTPAGDALIAHETAHAVQQQGADLASPGAATKMPSEQSPAHEEDADRAATGVLARLYRGTRSVARRLADNVGPALSSGFAIQRCKTTPEVSLDVDSEEIKRHLDAGDAAAAHEAIADLGGSRAGDATLRTLIKDSKLSAGDAYKASVLLELGPGGSWPKELKNYVDGVVSGEFSETRMCAVGVTVAALHEHAMQKADLGGSASPLDEYRSRFNAKWNVAPYDGIDPVVSTSLDSKGPRNNRARKIFEDLYNDAGLDVKRRYDDDDPSGYREQCDLLAVADGINTLASPRVDAVRDVFESTPTIKAANIAAAGYKTFKSKVEAAAIKLDREEREMINGSNPWRNLVWQQVEGPNPGETAKLRADLWNTVTETFPVGAGAAPVVEPDAPEPAIDAAARSFLGGVSFAPDKATITSTVEQQMAPFTVKSTQANPIAGLEASIHMGPEHQVASANPENNAWVTGDKSVKVAPEIATEGATAKTEFTATLRLPPVRDANFAPQTAKLTVEDQRLAEFQKNAEVWVESEGGNSINSIDAKVGASYYGQQLPINVHAYCATGNPGLDLLASGKVKAPGRPDVSFNATEFPSGTDSAFVGFTVVNEPAGLKGKETIEIELEITQSDGTVVASPTLKFPVLKGGKSTPAKDAARMSSANTKLASLLKAGDRAKLALGQDPGGGAMWNLMVFKSKDKQQAAVAKAVEDGLIKPIPMIVRSDSADWLRNNAGDPFNEVAWAAGSMANTFADTPDAVGFSDPNQPYSVILTAEGGRDLAYLANTLTHEAIHAVDIDETGHRYEVWDSYANEFRAWFLEQDYASEDTQVDPTMAGMGPKSPRARAVFEMMYQSSTYAYTRENYDSDPKFRARVNNYVYPDGINLPVSLPIEALRKIVDAYTGADFVKTRGDIDAAFKACSADDKKAIRGSRQWRDLIALRFHGKTHGSPAKSQEEIIKSLLGLPL